MKDQESKFRELERALGTRLRQLPHVEPDTGFKDRLRDRLVSSYRTQHAVAPSLVQRLVGRISSPLRLAAVAAVFLVALGAGWLAFFSPDGKEGPGPLFFLRAEAGTGGDTAGFRLTLGQLNALRQVRFETSRDLPKGPQSGAVIKLAREEFTVDEATGLARRLGMKDPQMVKDPQVGPAGQDEMQLCDEDEHLWVWLRQGSWIYCRMGQSPPLGSREYSQDKIKEAALDWLKAGGVLPREAYELASGKAEEYTGAVKPVYAVILRPKNISVQGRIFGTEPAIRVVLRSDGVVMSATCTWYTPAESYDTDLRSYTEALEALKRGEGVFEARNFRLGGSGTAVVNNVEQAYRLAYTLDLDPYLVPVAVFTGSYTPEGGTADDFTAYVSLLKTTDRPNAGNFQLDTSLPRTPASVKMVRERPLSETKAELRALAAHFGIEGEPDESGAYRGANGQELVPTSWDGGWLYRAPQPWDQQPPDKPLTPEQLLEKAHMLVTGLPALPGELGEPELLTATGGNDQWVVFPLLYHGLPVYRPDQTRDVPRIVVQFGPKGDVWSVNCGLPLEQTAETVRIITPDQAWEKLRANQSQVYVEGVYGPVPGKSFTAASSRVIEVRLAYVPRYPQLARNEFYDLKYVFSGEAQFESRKVSFTALVDAVE
jgi:hypothetical protein